MSGRCKWVCYSSCIFPSVNLCYISLCYIKKVKHHVLFCNSTKAAKRDFSHNHMFKVDMYEQIFTFKAFIADFQEHMQSSQACSCPFQIGIRYSYLTSCSSWTFGADNIENISWTAEIVRFLTESSLFRRNALANLMSTVYRLFNYNDFFFPASRFKCLQLTILLRFSCKNLWFDG